MKKQILHVLSVLSVLAVGTGLSFSSIAHADTDAADCCRGGERGPGPGSRPPGGVVVRHERMPDPRGPVGYPGPRGGVVVRHEGPIYRPTPVVIHHGPVYGPSYPTYPTYPSGTVYSSTSSCSTRQASDIYEEVDSLVVAHPENAALSSFEETLADVLRESNSSVKEARMRSIFGITEKAPTGETIVNAFHTKLISLGLSEDEATASVSRLISTLGGN